MMKGGWFSFSLRSRHKDTSSPLLLYKIVLWIVAKGIKQEKEIKDVLLKGGSKNHFSHRWHDLIHRKSRKFHKMAPRPNLKLSRTEGYRSKIPKLTYFSIFQQWTMCMEINKPSHFQYQLKEGNNWE